MGHPLPVFTPSVPSACWLQDSDLFPNVGIYVGQGKYRIIMYVVVEVWNWTDHLGWHINFRSAFDSVDRQCLWLLLRSKGIPEKILQLLEDLYSNTFSCVRVDGELSPWFEISCSVRQGYVVATELFLETMNWIMSCAAHKAFRGRNCGWGDLCGFRLRRRCLLASQHVGNIG